MRILARTILRLRAWYPLIASQTMMTLPAGDCNTMRCQEDGASEYLQECGKSSFSIQFFGTRRHGQLLFHASLYDRCACVCVCLCVCACVRADVEPLA